MPLNTIESFALHYLNHSRTIAHSKLLLLTHLVFVLRCGSLMLLTICHIRRAVEPYEAGQRDLNKVNL